MDKLKISPQEIYEVLEEQRKLKEIREKLCEMVHKVNHTINSLAVENLQLNQSIELSDNEEERPVQDLPPTTSAINSPPDLTFTYNQQEQSQLINQQMLEIDIKPCFDEEIDSDEEIDQL